MVIISGVPIFRIFTVISGASEQVIRDIADQVNVQFLSGKVKIEISYFVEV